jgi:hypothetical protein
MRRQRNITHRVIVGSIPIVSFRMLVARTRVIAHKPGQYEVKAMGETEMLVYMCVIYKTAATHMT